MNGIAVNKLQILFLLSLNKVTHSLTGPQIACCCYIVLFSVLDETRNLINLLFCLGQLSREYNANCLFSHILHKSRTLLPVGSALACPRTMQCRLANCHLHRWCCCGKCLCNQYSTIIQIAIISSIWSLFGEITYSQSVAAHAARPAAEPVRPQKHFEFENMKIYILETH